MIKMRVTTSRGKIAQPTCDAAWMPSIRIDPVGQASSLASDVALSLVSRAPYIIFLPLRELHPSPSPPHSPKHPTAHPEPLPIPDKCAEATDPRKPQPSTACARDPP